MKKLISFFLPVLLFLCLGMAGFGEETSSGFITSINPDYADVLTEKDLFDSNGGLSLYSSGLPETQSLSIVPTFSSTSSAKNYIRQEMVARHTSFSLILVSSTPFATGSGNAIHSTMAKLITSLIYDSMEDFPGCASYEGDYLRWHFGGFENAKYTLYRSGSSYCCEISIPKIKYYTTAAQEKKLTTDLKRVLASLDLDGKSEFEKAKRIYVYITSHVTYDYANLYNDSTGKYTAYNALEKGTAVCQGYASLLYRMMRMSGISCRFISGDGGGVRHGWNIVKVGSSYYNLDSTWDAGHDTSSFLYFLKSNKDFYGHTRDDRFKTSTFNTTYPMSKTSYKLTGTHKHTWSWVVTQAATIFKTGTKTKTCTVCGATRGTKTIAKKTASVTLNASSSTMQAGQRSTAIQIAKQASADSVSKWTSSDPSVVYVSPKTGKLEAKKKGSATITLIMKSGAKASVRIKVQKKTVKTTSILFKKKKVTLTAGTRQKLALTRVPVTANDKLAFTSSVPSVAKISRTGIVTTLSPGKTVITVKSASGKTAKCTLVVKAS